MRRFHITTAIWLLAALAASAGYVDDHFDSAPFALGTTFTTPVQGWGASDGSVMVTNDKSYTGSQSVKLPAGTTLSNTVSVAGPTVVWTDLRVAPVLGFDPSVAVTNGTTFVSYFDTNGWLNVWTGAGWQVCSTDVWGGAVPPVSAGVFSEVSICHNYALQKLAVLLNDRVVLQDQPFITPAVNYAVVGLLNTSSNAWLDDAYVQTNYDGSRLSSDRNGVDGPDALELQTYGYVARTFTVGAGQPYTTLAAALAVARDRDLIAVSNNQVYSETVTITHNLTLTGSVFTNTGTITVAAGKTLTLALSMAPTTLDVQGSVIVSSTTLSLSNLTIGVAGGISVTGGRLVVSSAGIDLSGTFTLDSRWGTAATASLNFQDDFESYGDGTLLASLGFRGWYASTASALVSAGQGYGSSKGVVLPAGSMVSNHLATSQTRIWIDFRVKPVPMAQPVIGSPAIETNGMALLCYVNTNGCLNVWSSGVWCACTEDVGGTPFTAMSTALYSRVTAFLDYDLRKACVFVDGRLARLNIGFPAGAPIPTCNTFGAWNGSGQAALDTVSISTNYPADLTADVDGDGIPDVLEIHLYETLSFLPSGAVFKIR